MAEYTSTENTWVQQMDIKIKKLQESELPNREMARLAVRLPRQSAFFFGHEEFGFSYAPGDYPDLHAVYIPQVGRVDSLNVSVAASIVMYEYTRQYQKASPDTPCSEPPPMA